MNNLIKLEAYATMKAVKNQILNDLDSVLTVNELTDFLDNIPSEYIVDSSDLSMMALDRFIRDFEHVSLSSGMIAYGSIERALNHLILDELSTELMKNAEKLCERWNRWEEDQLSHSDIKSEVFKI